MPLFSEVMIHHLQIMGVAQSWHGWEPVRVISEMGMRPFWMWSP